MTGSFRLCVRLGQGRSLMTARRYESLDAAVPDLLLLNRVGRVRLIADTSERPARAARGFGVEVMLSG